MSKRSMRNLLCTLSLSICLITLLLALQAGASRAAPRPQAAPASPAAKGSIAGVVRGPGGAPLPGISVLLARAIFPSGWNVVELAVTDAEGRYAMAQLAPGTYRVSFYDSNGVYGQQYYAQAITGESARPLAINGNALEGIDAQLALGGSIEGSVQGVAEGYGLIGAYVEAGGAWQLVTQAQLDDARHYHLATLPPATYHVCVSSGTWFAGSPPCYDRIGGGVAHATGVVLAAGEAITGIDIAAQGFVDAAALSGTVTSRSGEPLAGIRVAANGGNPFLASGWSAVAVTQTDAAGRYLLGDLPASNYVLDFQDANGDYLPQYYQGAASFERAEVVTVQPYEQRGHVDDQLARGGMISGSILFAGSFAPPTATVAAMLANPSQETTVVLFPGVYNPESGGYAIKPLPPGLYAVVASATDPANSSLGFSQYYGDSAHQQLLLTVTYGSRYEGIDFRLAEGAYEGTLTGTVTNDGGQPLGGIRVDLLKWPSALEAPLVYALTDAAGRFRFDGLADGSYYLHYTDPAGFYAPVYWGNEPRPSLAAPIALIGGQPTWAGDARLARSGRIRGQIRNAAGVALQGAQVTIRLNEDTLAMVKSAAGGTYDSGPLPAGDYTVCTYGYTTGVYAAACAGYEFGAPWPGLTVALAAGAEVEVDLVLGYVPQFPYKQYLPAVME